MNENVVENLYWYLIIVDDAPKFLPEESIYNALTLIRDVGKIEFVILNYIEGTGKYGLIRSLQENKNQVVEVGVFLEKFREVDHIEWRDFFLFKDYPKEWKNLNDEKYPNSIALTDVTLRAVDNQYMYIYTRSEKIVEAFKSRYVIESINKGLLDNLDYPD